MWSFCDEGWDEGPRGDRELLQARLEAGQQLHCLPGEKGHQAARERMWLEGEATMREGKGGNAASEMKLASPSWAVCPPILGILVMCYGRLSPVVFW